MNENHLMKTRNLNLAAYLMSKKIAMVRMERIEKIWFFVFLREEAEPLVNRFINKNPSIKVHDFVDAYSRIKKLIFGGEDERKSLNSEVSHES